MAKKKNTALIKVFIIILLCLFAAIEGAGWYIAGRQAGDNMKTAKTKKPRASDLKAKNSALRYEIASHSPSGIYIVIDTGKNTLFLKNGKTTVRQAVISSGSGSVLEDPNGERQWVFDTQRGEYAVKQKAVEPNWIKPDWAFIEEGEEIPKKYKDRIEEGVLGDYALGFGNGYFIHGTLYTRLLGRNVTHGCIRVGDKDLNALYQASSIGTRIVIF